MPEPAEFAGTERFSMIAKLGTGGMGVVYEAFDRKLGIPVALKVLRRIDPNAIYMFKNEFRALADLRHPNLVRLYDLIYDRDSDTWFFTMELLRGKDVLTYLTNPTPDPNETQVEIPGDAITAPSADSLNSEIGTPTSRAELPRLWEVLRQLAEGLTALHSAGKVHRDVKPSNVVCVEHNGRLRVVLVDFGLVVNAHTSDNTASFVGTPLYMAPEQASSGAVGPAADCYAVGVMLFRLLSGRFPVEGNQNNIIYKKQTQTPPALSSLVPDVPADLDALCRALLDRNPTQRPNAPEIVMWCLRQSSSMTLRIPTLDTRHEQAIWDPGTEASADIDATRVEDFNPRQNRLTTSVFVGRSAELQFLSEELDASREGGRLVLIEGDSGVGKSSLLRAFVERLPPEVLVFSGRCYERESVPYKALDGLVDALSRHLLGLRDWEHRKLVNPDLPLLATLFPVLRRVPFIADLGEPSPSGDPLELRSRAAIALRALLTSLSQTRPLICIIDDLQWADSDSYSLLSEALHDPTPPLLLICAQRPSREHPPLHIVQMTDFILEDLDEKDAVQLVNTVLGDDAENQAWLLAAEARGNPMFLLEIARDIAASGQPGQVNLDDAIWRRVSGRNVQERRILALLSLAGAPLLQSVLAKAAGVSPEEFAGALVDLRAAQLLRSEGDASKLEPYHDRIRETIAARLSPDERRDLHLSLAEALEQAPDPDAQALALHFEEGGDSNQAAHYATQAAERAARALAFDQAAGLYQRVLSLVPGSNWKIWHGYGETLGQAGRGPEAADALLEAAARAPQQDRLVCVSRAAEHLLGSGHLDRARQVLVGVLASIGERWPATPHTALASLLWHRTRIWARGYNYRRRTAAACPPEDLLRLDVYNAISVGMGPVDNLAAADFQARALLTALQAGEPVRLARAFVLEAIFMALEGGHRRNETDTLLRKAEELALSLDMPYLRHLATMGAGICHFAFGEFASAARLLTTADQALRLLPDAPIWERQNLRVYRLLSFRQMGHWHQLDIELDALIEDARRRSNRLSESTLIRNIVQQWLARDQAAKAQEALERNPWPGSPGNYHAQQFNELLAHGDLALYQGRAYEASRALAPSVKLLWDSFLLRTQIMRSEACWFRGRLALSALPQSSKSERSALLAEIDWLTHQLSWEKMPYTRVWSLLLRAGYQWQQHKKSETKQSLQEAVWQAEQSQIDICAHAARYRLGSILPGNEGRNHTELSLDWTRQQRITNPARFFELIAPGFEPVPAL